MNNEIRIKSRSSNVDVYTFKMSRWWLTVVSVDYKDAVPPSVYRSATYEEAVKRHMNSCAFAQGYYSHIF